MLELFELANLDSELSAFPKSSRLLRFLLESRRIVTRFLFWHLCRAFLGEFALRCRLKWIKRRQEKHQFEYRLRKCLTKKRIQKLSGKILGIPLSQSQTHRKNCEQ